MGFPIPQTVTTQRCLYKHKHFLFCLHPFLILVGKKFEVYSWKYVFYKYVSPKDKIFALLLFEKSYKSWCNMAANGK